MRCGSSKSVLCISLGERTFNFLIDIINNSKPTIHPNIYITKNISLHVPFGLWFQMFHIFHGTHLYRKYMLYRNRTSTKKYSKNVLDMSNTLINFHFMLFKQMFDACFIFILFYFFHQKIYHSHHAFQSINQ